jgi:hypothetical protein
MTGRRTSAVRAPEGTLALLMLDALQRYRAEELVLPADALFFEILGRLTDAE